ncbi:MAG: long-subunit acyl-CoA synthetase (AMP-forming) [Alphaproteobacteria bacterium]|jgi:long-subunit acyl-CoA synthetase (AMP-forming)
MNLFEHLSTCPPEKIAVSYENKHYPYSQLKSDVSALSVWLQSHNIMSVGINLENSYEWIVADLACQHASIICTPIPQFFSQQQLEHLIAEAKPTLILGNPLAQSARFEEIPNLAIKAYFLSATGIPATPKKTSKITFTSGSTGQAKGVCLSIENQLKVASSLVTAISVAQPKHLVLLPLPTLLENISGVYAPLLAMGHVLVANDQEKGFAGSRLVDLAALLQCISTHNPNTMILVPELLQALIAGCQNGWKPPTSLTFIAVGGAKVEGSMILQARAFGLPVYQGYGLSECGSVVSLCRPNISNDESAGEVLEHLSVYKVAGELVVSGNCFLGYLGQADSWYPEFVNTGDLVTIKLQGLHQGLYITGRNKNLIINSFGRNISPEWIESKIIASGLFAQAVVVGDAKPFICALLVPRSPLKSAQIDSFIDKVNERLPDYAKIMKHIVIEQGFTAQNRLVTENGKLIRDAISTFYAKQINQQYTQPTALAV